MASSLRLRIFSCKAEAPETGGQAGQFRHAPEREETIWFALDTYRDVVSADPRRRVQAFFTFSLWFAAGGYISSSLLPYLPVVEGTLPTVIGGIVASGLVAALKIS